MKRVASITLFAILVLPFAAFGQQDEKYERVSPTEFKIKIVVPKGASFKVTNGIANGGPVKDLFFWGHKITLMNEGMVQDGFLQTKDYGNFQFVSNIDGSFRVDLTPSQQKKLLELKNRNDTRSKSSNYPYLSIIR